MFFFTDTPTTAIYTLSLHDALPIFAGEVEVLLDEDHGHPEARVDADQLAQDLIHDGRLDPLGRLVQQQDLRAADERPGDREDLLLAAGQAPAPLVEPLAEPGEDLEELGHPRRRPRP